MGFQKIAVATDPIQSLVIKKYTNDIKNHTNDIHGYDASTIASVSLD